MNIAILGTGNMAQPLGALARAAGHPVIFGSRQATGERVSMVEAAQRGDLVILAVPYEAALDLASQSDIQRALSGKIVIDITNPLAPDYMSLTVGHTSSAAERLQERLPDARLVKAFNTIFADVLKAKSEGETVRTTVFVASDDAAAKAEVLAIAADWGFARADAGALRNARYLEPVTELAIQLAYGQGLGTRIGIQLTTIDE
jgi:hypothetical protein